VLAMPSNIYGDIPLKEKWLILIKPYGISISTKN
jgi:hypothetical protein